MNFFCKVALFFVLVIWWKTPGTDGSCCEDCDCTVTVTTTYSVETSNVTEIETESNGTVTTETNTVNTSVSTTSTTTTSSSTSTSDSDAESTTASSNTEASNAVASTSAGAAASTTALAETTTVAGESTTTAAYSSCKALLDAGYTTSGEYNINVGGDSIEVYCEQTTDGGGWLEFQKRASGDQDFYLDWDSYKDGFGNLTNEHWLGLTNLYNILQTGDHELRVDLWNTINQTKYAKYGYFDIGPESDQFKLTNISSYSGDAGDSLSSHQGANFTTRDRDNDNMEGHNCAVLYTGAWWYQRCYDSSLNGRYFATEGRGVVWTTWHTGSLISKSSMKIREL